MTRPWFQEVLMLVVLIPLALLAGAITTVAGMGGGIMLLLGLSLVMDPIDALMVTGTGLLVGNVHRAWMYRADIDKGLATRYALGGAPGALIGGLVAVALPPGLIRLLMITLAVLASAKVLLRWEWKPPKSTMVPGGAAVGFVTATSGGGGLLAGPLLLASGLTGRRYVATAAVGASVIHVFRLTGYGIGGALGPEELILGALAAVCIATGNVIGDKVRSITPERWFPKLEVGVVVVLLTLALAGVA